MFFKNYKFLIIALVLLVSVFSFWKLFNKQENFQDKELKEKIGQMLMIGFRGTDLSKETYIKNVIKEITVGGVVLTDYDVPSKSYPRNIESPSQVKKLIKDLQGISKIPLFIGVDVEGGKVNRLKEKYGFIDFPSAKEMGLGTVSETQQIAKNIGKELSDLGFNINFAPVVDVDINPKNSIIGGLERSFSFDVQKVISHANAFIKGLHEYNIISVIKHFPGHGSSNQDSHLGIVDVTNTYNEIELKPYEELIKNKTVDMVMTAHIINKNVDKNFPATLSSKFIQDILREKIGFDGVIISDDIQMSAISSNYNFEEAIIRAVSGGCDIIYIFNNSSVGYDEKLIYRARDAIFNAVKEKKIEEKIITESYDRIVNLKNQYKIINLSKTLEGKDSNSIDENIQKITEIKNKKFELLGTSETITFEEAVNIAKYVGEIAKIRPAFLLSIFQEELSLEKFDLCYLTNFNTGEGIRIIDGKILPKTMHPTRDIHYFLDITKELGKDPLKTLITCPMSFGWGGAMGPADFIPSTWIQYKNHVQKITGKIADPWNIKDAFLAAGLYLSDSGASLKTRDGEWKAAMIYFSGSSSSPYVWYANDAIKFSDQIQADIDQIN